MINPSQITVFDNTLEGLEEFVLFAICVAGKNAKQQAIKLEKFIQLLPPGESPFARIAKAGDIRPLLEQVKMGQYTRITKAFRTLANIEIDLRTAPTDEFEKIPGVGLKTSRFFILHSRACARVACLDTHILRYLREELNVDAPKATPTNPKRYSELEAIFLQHCDVIHRIPAELDLEIWVKYSNQSKNEM
jgi:thermostable 8-oxoguanine DNA glycosylase